MSDIRLAVRLRSVDTRMSCIYHATPSPIQSMLCRTQHTRFRGPSKIDVQACNFDEVRLFPCVQYTFRPPLSIQRPICLTSGAHTLERPKPKPSPDRPRSLVVGMCMRAARSSAVLPNRISSHPSPRLFLQPVRKRGIIIHFYW